MSESNNRPTYNPSRRSFLRSSVLGAGALALSPYFPPIGPLVGATSRDVVFRPYPHPSMPPPTWAYGADEFEDPFKSSMSVAREGIIVGDDVGSRRFSVNARWYVEGFGYVWLSADNAGRKYTLADASKTGQFHLNYEFARSRIARNREVRSRYEKDGTRFSAEVKHLTALSEELFEDATKRLTDGERAARLSDRCLKYALWVGEKIELEKAKSDIERRKRTDHVQFGCETRQYIWAKSEDFVKRFVEVMNHATITHYVWDTWYELFEPREGVYNWGIKDNIVNWLTEHGITIEGRPLLWFHPAVTPEWLKNKNFDELKKYVENHVRNLVGHYGDKVHEWEVVNEYHDWANIHNHTPEQITEIVRLACDKTKETNPKIVRVLNNCCPWAEYAARGRMAGMDATRPLRSPRKFLQEITDAGVEYEVLGIQIYFPQRDLSDIVRLLERLAVIGKPIAITEIGASSNLIAPTSTGAITGSKDEPYAWHRHWDEELQADWLEQVYTIYYSKPYINAINWYDFSDFRPFIINGGLIREDSTPKRSHERLKRLLASWNRLPAPRTP
jgi:endo-1,4-beta-xylanase